VRCQTSLGSPLPSAGSSGGQFGVPVVTARDCVWSVASEVSWLKVSPLSGQGESTLTLTVAENDQPEARTGAFLLNEERFMVAQEAAPQPPGPRPQPPPPSPSTCSYALDPSSSTFGRQGGTGSFRVITGPGCAWAAASTTNWIVIVSGAAQIGPGEVHYRVSSFNGRQRTGAILAAGRTHTIVQDRDRD
jgi:hypothetical protein